MKITELTDYQASVVVKSLRHANRASAQDYAEFGYTFEKWHEDNKNGSMALLYQLIGERALGEHLYFIDLTYFSGCNDHIEQTKAKFNNKGDN